jgi:hypothetical protein
MSNKINAPKIICRRVKDDIYSRSVGPVLMYCKPLVHLKIVLTSDEDMFYQLRQWF